MNALQVHNAMTCAELAEATGDAELEATLTALFQPEMKIGDDWLPTIENINRLPEPLRKFVADLETRCDPSGDVRELAIARDTIRQLEGLFAEQRNAS